jgi:hypothetical protein
VSGAKLFRHILGVSVFRQERYFVLGKSGKSSWFVRSNANVLHDIRFGTHRTASNFGEVFSYGRDFAIPVDEAFAAERESVNIPFMRPPPTAFAKK